MFIPKHRRLKIVKLVVLEEFKDDPIDFLLYLGPNESVIDMGSYDYPLVGGDVDALVAFGWRKTEGVSLTV